MFYLVNCADYTWRLQTIYSLALCLTIYVTLYAKESLLRVLFANEIHKAKTYACPSTLPTDGTACEYVFSFSAWALQTVSMV